MNATLDDVETTTGRPTLVTRPMTLLDVLLDEQQDLSAVEKFSNWHDVDGPPVQAKFYSSLIPASPPGPGGRASCR